MTTLRSGNWPHPLTAEERARGGRLADDAAQRLTAIKTQLDRAPRASDRDLAQAQDVLSLWVAQQIQADRVLLTAKTPADANAQTLNIAKKLMPLSHQLQGLAVEVQGKFPGVRDWSFLPTV